MHVYLAGPMRGLPDYNYPLFNEVTDLLRGTGIQVTNPASPHHHEIYEQEGIIGVMALDLRSILYEVDTVWCLPGWQLSPGATTEAALAICIDKPVAELIDLQRLRDFGVITLRKILSVRDPYYSTLQPEPGEVL